MSSFWPEAGFLRRLFPFSDERLVREIVRYPIPVVSAVGHETDFF